MATIEKPTFATGTTAADLAISALQVIMPGDQVFLAMGIYDSKADVQAAFADQSAIATLLDASFVELGEFVKDEAAKIDSTVEEIETRHHVFAGVRNTPVEITMAGIGQNQRDFLESNNFQGQTTIVAILSKDRDRAVIYNGLTWITNWTASDKNVSTAKIKAKCAGVSADKIVVMSNIPEGV